MPDPRQLGSTLPGLAGLNQPVYQVDPEQMDRALQQLTSVTTPLALTLGGAAVGGPGAMALRTLGPAALQALLGPFTHPDPNVLQGIAVLPETVPKFTRALEEAESGLTRTGDPLIDRAVAWLETRYPRFTAGGRPSLPKYAATEGQLGQSTLGKFTPTSRGGYVHLNPEAIGRYAREGESWRTASQREAPPSWTEAPTSVPENDPLARAIQTLAHEMTHARQFAKMGPGMSKEALAGVPYEEREIERLARAAGATAMESYLKYLQYLAGK